MRRRSAEGMNRPAVFVVWFLAVALIVGARLWFDNAGGSLAGDGRIDDAQHAWLVLFSSLTFAAAMVLTTVVRSQPATLGILGVVAAGAAAALWWGTWNAFDSSCSLATRNDPAVRGACADGAADLMPWFITYLVAAVGLLGTAIFLAMRRSRLRPPREFRGPSTSLHRAHRPVSDS